MTVEDSRSGPTSNFVDSAFEGADSSSGGVTFNSALPSLPLFLSPPPPHNNKDSEY